MESEFDYFFVAAFATPLITEFIKKYLNHKGIKASGRYISLFVVALFSIGYAGFMSFASEELISQVSFFAGSVWATGTAIYKLQK